ALPICARVLLPEPVARGAYVPVGEHVEVLTDLRCGGGDVVRFHVRADAVREVPGTGEDVAVHHGEARGLLGGDGTRVETARAVGRATADGVGVQGEEVVRVPQRQEHPAHLLADGLLAHDEVPAAQPRRTHAG